MADPKIENADSERIWIRPDLPSRCTFHLGMTEEKDSPHKHKKRFDINIINSFVRDVIIIDVKFLWLMIIDFNRMFYVFKIVDTSTW